jgi:hypothetical protein
VLLRHPTKSAIKVIDFGSSCFEHEKSKATEQQERLHATYVTTYSLHVHPKSVLPVAGGHPGNELPHGHRHVESRLHSGGTEDRVPHLPRRKRARTIILHHGSSRSPRQGLRQPKFPQATLLRYVRRVSYDFLSLFWIRLHWCPSTRGKLEGTQEKARNKDPLPSSPLRR